MTFFDSQLRKVPGGHHITHVVFVAYIHHLLSNQSSAFAIPHGNNSSGTAKAAIIKAVSNQQQIGKVLTLRGYLTKTWSEAMLTDLDQDITSS